jgi:divalent metal cation (Fe/Co/Zn/Cd) transporter
VVNLGARSTKSLRLRLEGAFRALLISFLLSLAGTVVDAVVFSVSGGLILMTDLLHWVVDTILEGVLLLVLHLASRIGRRFPWSLLMLEGVATSLGTVAVLTAYGYFFLDYLRSVAGSGAPSYVGYVPLVATITGAAITGTMFLVQRRNYLKYRVELLNFDSTHALIDLAASTMASAGIVATTATGSYVAELFFTFMLMTFVVHSLLEVLKDNVKAITGSNRVPNLESYLFTKLSELDSEKARVRNVVVRRFGSLSVVEVTMDVNPRVTVLELHRIRGRIIRTARDSSELVYHVDVKFYPGQSRRSSTRLAKNKKG